MPPDWTPAVPPVERILLLDVTGQTAAPTIGIQENGFYRGVELVLEVSVNPGVQTLTLSLSGATPDDTPYSLVTGAAITSGLDTIQLYPGLPTGAAPNATESRILPSRWKADVAHSGAGAWAYKLWAVLYR